MLSWYSAGSIRSILKRFDVRLALDPSNPELHFALGKIPTLNAGPETRSEEQQEFRMSTNMNPYSARFWSGLGKACCSSANPSCADTAFRSAQQLAPGKPQIAWNAPVKAFAAPEGSYHNGIKLCIKPPVCVAALEILACGECACRGHCSCAGMSDSGIPDPDATILAEGLWDYWRYSRRRSR